MHGVSVPLDASWATPPIVESMDARTYERKEAHIVEATVVRSDRVTEVGSGAGFVTTLLARRAARVVAYEANPAMVAVAKRTLERNAASAEVVNATLAIRPEGPTSPFYVHEDFVLSGLHPVPGSHPIEVPVLDLHREIERNESSYLVMDIEGGEVDLFREPLPGCVRRLCVECHPDVVGRRRITAMLGDLFQQGFELDLLLSAPPVVFLERP